MVVASVSFKDPNVFPQYSQETVPIHEEQRTAHRLMASQHTASLTNGWERGYLMHDGAARSIK